MNPYAKPNERKVGAQRPKISHLPSKIDNRTRKDRQAEKQAVAAERRAIKKSARQQLKQKLLEDLEAVDYSARHRLGHAREGALPKHLCYSQSNNAEHRTSNTQHRMKSNDPLYLNEEQVRKHLRMEKLIPAMEKELIEFSAGKVKAPVPAVSTVDRTG